PHPRLIPGAIQPPHRKKDFQAERSVAPHPPTNLFANGGRRMRIAVVTGNPKPGSRTQGVALAVADTLAAGLDPSSPPPSTRPPPPPPGPAPPARPRPPRAAPRGPPRRHRHLRVADLQGRLHRHAQGLPGPLRQQRSRRYRRGSRHDRRLARPPAGGRGPP